MKNDKLQMILAMVIFGTIGLVRRYIPYPSEWIAFIRGFVGVSFLLLLQMLHKKTFVWEPVKHNLALLLVSGACLGFNWILLFEAYCYTSVAVALFSYIDPIVAVLLSAFVLHEAMTPVMAAGVVLVIVSAVVSEIDLTA